MKAHLYHAAAIVLLAATVWLVYHAKTKLEAVDTIVGRLVTLDKLAYHPDSHSQQRHLDTMDADEYREALDKLKMSQVAAGEMFEVGSRTSRRWALGEARIPRAVAMVLNLMVKKRLKVEVPVINNDAYRVWTFSAVAKE